MEPFGGVVALLCLAALIALAAPTMRVWRAGQRYAGLAALSLPVAALTLLAAVVAQLTGAARLATGRFLIGMGVGVAVGLTISAALLLARFHRQ